MTFLFASLGDLAEHLRAQAADSRVRSQKSGLTQVQRASLVGQAFAYEQSAMIIRNTEFKDIAA